MDVFDIVVGFSKGCVYTRCKSEVMLDSLESMALDSGQVDGYSTSFWQLADLIEFDINTKWRGSDRYRALSLRLLSVSPPADQTRHIILQNTRNKGRTAVGT